MRQMTARSGLQTGRWPWTEGPSTRLAADRPSGRADGAELWPLARDYPLLALLLDPHSPRIQFPNLNHSLTVSSFHAYIGSTFNEPSKQGGSDE